MRTMGVTLGEAMAQQDVDPAYQAMRAAKGNEHAERVEQRRREAKPLLDDLAAIGVVIDGVQRLLSIPRPDDRIYPILLDHLRRTYSPHLLEWIGRSFGTKSARPVVWEELVSLLKDHTLEKSAADGVMVAVSEMAQPRDLPTLIELISNRCLGQRRIFLVSNLMRSKRPEARATLVRLQDDPDLIEEIEARLHRARG